MERSLPYVLHPRFVRCKCGVRNSSACIVPPYGSLDILPTYKMPQWYESKWHLSDQNPCFCSIAPGDSDLGHQGSKETPRKRTANLPHTTSAANRATTPQTAVAAKSWQVLHLTNLNAHNHLRLSGPRNLCCNTSHLQARVSEAITANVGAN